MTRDELREIAIEATCPRCWIDIVCTSIMVGCAFALIVAVGG